MGSGRDPRSEMGPVVASAAQQRIESLITSGEAQGAKVPADGRGLRVDGFFVGPTVIDQVTTSMDVYTEEIFGPVLSVIRADDADASLHFPSAS